MATGIFSLFPGDNDPSDTQYRTVTNEGCGKALIVQVYESEQSCLDRYCVGGRELTNFNQEPNDLTALGYRSLKKFFRKGQSSQGYFRRDWKVG